MSVNSFILILEQNSVDASYLERYFLEQRTLNTARVVRTADRLRCYLEGVGSYQNRQLFPLPGLLLLDLHYSNSGLATLSWLRADGFLDKFPVIGIGSSILENVVRTAFDLGLSGYLEKPSDLGNLARMICRLEWIGGIKPKLPSDSDIQIITHAEFSSRPKR